MNQLAKAERGAMDFVSKPIHESFEHLTKMLVEHKRVFFTRFGDGEIYSMFGKDCLEHNANPVLSEALKESFRIIHPNYLKAVGVNFRLERGMMHGLFAPFVDNDLLAQTLFENFEFVKGARFENHVMFHYLSVFEPELMIGFLDEFVRPRKKMFIGGTPRDQVEKLYGHVHYHIQTPPRNAFSCWNDWWPEVEKNLEDVDLVIPSVGVTSNVINYRLWELGAQVHSLDIGSLVDAAHGKSSRKWIRLKGHTINKILLHEFQEHSLRNKAEYQLKELRFLVKKMWYGSHYNVPENLW